MKFDVNSLQWTRAPHYYEITQDRIAITTEPQTGLWQRTYYHFRNDNAPLLQMSQLKNYFHSL